MAEDCLGAPSRWVGSAAQALYQRLVSALDREVPRALPVVRTRGRVRSAREQQLHKVRLPVLRGAHQGREAAVLGRVGIGARVQQQTRDLQMTPGGGRV